MPIISAGAITPRDASPRVVVRGREYIHIVFNSALCNAHDIHRFGYVLLEHEKDQLRFHMLYEPMHEPRPFKLIIDGRPTTGCRRIDMARSKVPFLENGRYDPTVQRRRFNQITVTIDVGGKS